MANNVDRVIILNLERREDKFFYMLGALQTAGFPFNDYFVDGHPEDEWDEFLIRFLSCDGLGFDSCDAIVDDALHHGFTCFSKFNCHELHPEKDWRFAYAVTYTWYRVLNKIAQQDFTCMVLYDDVIPHVGWTYTDFMFLTSLAVERGNFKMLQLKAYPFSQPYPQSQEPEIGDGFLIYDDLAFVISPEGAKSLLPQFSLDRVNAHLYIDSEVANCLYDNSPNSGYYHTKPKVLHQTEYFFNSDIQPNHIIPLDRLPNV